MRWGSLSEFVQNVLGQANPRLTTIGGWLCPSEGLGVRVAVVSGPAFPWRQAVSGFWGGWNKKLASHSYLSPLVADTAWQFPVADIGPC